MESCMADIVEKHEIVQDFIVHPPLLIKCWNGGGSNFVTYGIHIGQKIYMKNLKYFISK